MNHVVNKLRKTLLGKLEKPRALSSCRTQKGTALPHRAPRNERPSGLWRERETRSSDLQNEWYGRNRDLLRHGAERIVQTVVQFREWLCSCNVVTRRFSGANVTFVTISHERIFANFHHCPGKPSCHHVPRTKPLLGIVTTRCTFARPPWRRRSRVSSHTIYVLQSRCFFFSAPQSRWALIRGARWGKSSSFLCTTT